MGLSPELRLLCACVRRQLGTAEARSGLRALVERDELDWEAAVHCAARHGLGAWLLQAADEELVDVMPEEPHRTLVQQTRRWARRSLLLVNELTQLVERFDAHDIPLRVWKGPVLAYDLYGGTGRRPFTDLDLAVPQSAFSAADRLLRTRGYECKTSSEERRYLWGGTPSFQYVQPEGGRIVDLHCRPCKRPFGTASFNARLREGRRTVRIAGEPVPTFAAEDTFVMLCLHGTRHVWARLGWMVDCAVWMRRKEATNWERVCSLARQARGRRAVEFTGRLVRQFFGIPVPEPLAASEDNPPDRCLQTVSRQLMRSDFPSLKRRIAFYARLLPGLLPVLLYVGGLVRRPTRRDLRVLNVPARLFALGYVVRPLRLTCKYGRRWARRLSHWILAFCF